MSLKFDHLMAILNKLDAGERVTSLSLREDLNISERSAFRYIESLNSAGFPVWYDRSKGSYVFVEGYKLKKPILPAEEALALALAKKVLTPLGSTLNDNLESVRKRLSGSVASHDHIVVPKEIIPKGIEEYFLQIHKAILDRRVIEINYHAVSTDKVQLWVVEPAHLFFNDGYWYLRAYSQQESALRTFGLDRIRSLSILDGHFAPLHPSPDEDLKGAFGSMVDGEPAEVIVRFQPPMVQQIQRRQWHASQRDKLLADGTLEVQFTVNGTEGLKRWIYHWLPWAEVIAPEKFRLQVAEELAVAATNHRLYQNAYTSINREITRVDELCARNRDDDTVYDQTAAEKNLLDALSLICPRTHDDYCFVVWCRTRPYPVRDVIEDYVRRRAIGRPETLCHKILARPEWCLPQTWGLPVYREQFVILWRELSGCWSSSQAEKELGKIADDKQLTPDDFRKLLKSSYANIAKSEIAATLSTIRKFSQRCMPYYLCSCIVTRAGVADPINAWAHKDACN